MCSACQSNLTVPDAPEELLVDRPEPGSLTFDVAVAPVLTTRVSLLCRRLLDEPGRLLDLLNVPLFSFVLFCFFMPLMQFSCGTLKADWTGTNLAMQTMPEMMRDGQPAFLKGEEDLKEGQEEKKPTYPRDSILWLMPLLACLGLVLSVGGTLTQ